MKQNKKIKKYTLCLIHQHPMILLGMKKRGFGTGKWNGFGGKVEKNENIEEAAKREIKEEAEIEAQTIEKIGINRFEFLNNPEIMEVHIFRADNFSGNPAEIDEMKPKWFHINEIPFDEMWPDDKHWFPLFLENKKFEGYFLFDENENIIKHQLTII